MTDHIRVETNPDWVNPESRPACKYAPVIVAKEQSDEAIEYMKEVLQNRIENCRKLAAEKGDPYDLNWFSFIRGAPAHEPHLRPGSVPVIVLSGGAAEKLKTELTNNYSLAWHPVNVRNEPVYLLVHKLEYETYADALGEILQRYKNLHLVGWHGRGLTGFGPARAAALALADTLPYRPQRIVMMDHDVVQSSDVRLSSARARSKVEDAHATRTKPVIGYGVGYPTRVPAGEIKRNEETGVIETTGLHKVQEDTLRGREYDPPKQADFNSPAQQFVSIEAPFRNKADDGAYPAYMVSGGEDMLMGLQLELEKDGSPLMTGRIVKKNLEGSADTKNPHWSELRVDMLNELYEKEKDTRIRWNGEDLTIDALLDKFVACDWLKQGEKQNTSSLITERIILRLHKLGMFPEGLDQTIFNRYQKTED